MWPKFSPVFVSALQGESKDEFPPDAFRMPPITIVQEGVMTSHKWLRAGSTGLTLFAVLMSVTARLPAQDSMSPPIAVSLLKRLGAAVDGYRTGHNVWVVASLQFPHEVAGVFTRAVAADSEVHRRGDQYRRFGPYYAPPDSGLPTVMMVVPCRKNIDSSCTPLDSMPRDSFAIRPTAIDSIQSVTLIIQKKSGRTMRTTVGPNDAEAFFLTMSAVDKYLIPYYTQLYGAEYAADFRARLLLEFIRRSEQ
jgi:hypothetical protein